MEPPESTQPLSLVDMPAAWLVQLPKLVRLANPVVHDNFSDEEADEEDLPAGVPELLALFRTCRAMRDLVGSESNLKLRFKLPIPSHQTDAAQAKLLLALKHSTNIKLQLNKSLGALFLSYGQPIEESDVDDTDSSASNLLHGCMTAAGHGLDAITSVETCGLNLNAVVPPWLVVTCPTMTTLRHDISAIVLPALTASLPVCGQISNLIIRPSPSQPVDQSMLARWQQQLRALTGLTSLRLNSGTRAHTTWLLECCSAIAPQLTALTLWRCEPADLPQLAAWYPCLTELCLRTTTVDDQGMEAVLSMQLQRFTCQEHQLQHSYSHRPCTWKHLGVVVINAAQFDQLPLASVQSIGDAGGDMALSIDPCDLSASSRVAAVVARCGGITARELSVSCSSSDNLMAAMAVLSSCRFRFLSIMRRQVTPELLAALKHHLPSTKAAGMSFIECTFAPEAWPLLLPSLPPLDRLTLHCGMGEATNTPSEAEATIMSVHACRPIKMQVTVCNARGGWEEGWQERVQAAMAAAGHQHVQISFN